ncbi:MAG: hypothetical protein IID31_10450 [Planctomycetes bacterium]|nr:hypothetical protein [Planctomycetota bacterium]
MRTTTLFTMMAVTTALLAGRALAQTNGTYLLTSSNTVSPSSPTTTIAIWAAWDDPSRELIFGGGNYDLTAGDGVFSNPVNVLQGPGSSTGVINGNVITGGANGQILLPFPPWFPPANPILLATYDWTTTNFMARTVDLRTNNTSIFLLGDWRTVRVIELYPHEFTHGSGVINVIPVPAAWVVLALPLVAATRRRRL